MHRGQREKSVAHLGAVAWGRAALVGIAYFVLAVAAYRFTRLPELGFALIWPASGVVLAALLIAPRREWPLLSLAVAIGCYLGLLLTDVTPLRAIVWTIADLVDPLLAAWLIRRALPTEGLSLLRVREVYLLIVFGGIVGPLAGAALTTSFSLLTGFSLPLSGFAFSLAWWASAFLGVIGVAPLILALGRGGWRLRRSRMLEAAALVAVVVLLVAYGFRTSWQVGQFAAVAVAAFPILAWAAIRFGPAGAAWGTVGISVASMVLTVHGDGPFTMSPESPTHTAMLTAQGFISLAAITAYLLAAAFDERRRQLGGQAALVDAGATLACFEPMRTRLQSALECMEGTLGDSLLLLRPPSSTGKMLFQAGELPDPLGLRLIEEVEEEPEQRCEGGRCWLVVPLQPAAETGGRLAVRASPRRRYFDLGEEALVLGFANRIALALEAERLLREAEEAVRTRDEFLSIASHELKTPLTPLAARLQLLRRRVRSGQAVDEDSIARVQASLFRLTWLINDLLDVARIGTGALSLQEAPVSFVEAVDAAVDLVQPDDAGRIRWHEPRGEGLVLGDRNRLEQVAANLVDNALKYSPADEPVDVHVEETDDEVVLKVIDRGPGIPAEEREQLFDRLFRGRGGTGSRLGGLGLGLYIVRDIVERHGGKVWVDSKVGEGSTFQVSLPLLETERQRAGSWMQPSPPA